jgi:hypothetical protein
MPWADGHGRRRGSRRCAPYLVGVAERSCRDFPGHGIRLSKAFGRSPESWLQLQLQYDLWQAEQRSGTIKVKHFPMPAPC